MPDIDRILLDTRQPLTLLAEQGEQLLGFVRTARRRVTEYAGDAQAVATLIRAAFERLDDPGISTSDRDSRNMPVLDASLRVVSPACGTPLSRYLDELGILRSRSYLGTMRVIDAAGLLESFGLHGAAVAAEGDTITVEYRNETATLDVRMLSKLLLGPERVSPLWTDVLPGWFYVWPWDRV